MRQHKTLLYLPFLFIGTLSCQSGDNEGKTIASTHPKLEEGLQEDSVQTPVSTGQNQDLYQRYRITTEDYETGGAYAVTTLYRGTLAPLDLNSHTDARTHQKALADGLQQGINFAGRYTVVTIACGDNCQNHYIINRENGQVTGKLQGKAGARFSPDSRLLLLNPADSTNNYSTCSNCAPEAYVLDNNTLTRLGGADGQ